SFEPKSWILAKQTRHWSFTERIDRIGELLVISKTKCNALPGDLSLHLVVANPNQRSCATVWDVR
ncbi:hypothetical protein COCCADRAFT_102935, partial [Bipolaris zeicola 26-R-13]